MERKGKEELYGLVAIIKGFDLDAMQRVVNGLVGIIDMELHNSKEAGYHLVVSCYDKDGKKEDHKKPIPVQKGKLFTIETRSIKFHFYAKDHGEDTITISYYTTHMHVPSTSRVVENNLGTSFKAQSTESDRKR